ncbi:hypothetical protein BD779DRAFT_1477011 [Infundibulicybe gibba]|nr:hypothetical protein BD779DRAFT_1477011 [Infundibulicybe gibba]
MSRSKKQRAIAFNVVLFGDGPDQLFQVKAGLNMSVSRLRELVKEKAELNAVAKDLRLYKIDLSGYEKLNLDTFTRKIREAIPVNCLQPTLKVCEVFPAGSPRDKKIHIVVVHPDDIQDLIQDQLENHCGELFRRLKVSVAQVGSWAESDITRNLGGGEKFAPGALQQQYAFFRQEFAAFFNFMHSHSEDSAPAKATRSSGAKAHYLATYFMSPLFQSSEDPELRGLEYTVDMPWAFPMFVTPKDRKHSCCKYVPKSDLMVEFTELRYPLIISEVISLKNKSDRTRMLLQAIAMARAGQYLINEGEQFFVVAIYLDAGLVAERYMVAQIGSNDKARDRIALPLIASYGNFDLSIEEKAVPFLREMHNLVSKLRGIAGNFDPSKKDLLTILAKGAAGLRSLTAATEGKRKKPEMKALEGINESEENDAAVGGENDEAEIMEDGQGGDTDDDSTIFYTDDIQTIVANMGYRLSFPLFEHPLVAMVTSITDDSIGFLKFVPHGRNEIQILQHLSAINSPNSPCSLIIISWGNSSCARYNVPLCLP